MNILLVIIVDCAHKLNCINVNIIVVCHKKPNWFLITDKRIKFIFVNSIIFNNLKNLDEKSKNIIYYKNNIYYEYLNYPGKFHNKDKGLKYFIALCGASEFLKITPRLL